MVVLFLLLTMLTMRVTSYTWTGAPMASGYWPRPGVAACSDRFAFGTVFVLPDGREVVCWDRGHGDHYWPGVWLDIYVTSDAEVINNTYRYGDWTEVRVYE